MGKLGEINGNDHNNDNNNQELFRRPTTKQSRNSKTKKTKKEERPLKITYISSPTLVKATTASEFRALVQELTGKNSRLGEEDYCEDHRLFPNSSTTTEKAEIEQGRDVDPDEAFFNAGIHYSSNCLFV
ncbi:hypothetical protein LINGRAPRIM_LOCUS3357 [Linum grandiflorum]